MFTRILCLGAAVLLLSDVAEADERMLGKWKVVSIKVAGQELPQEQIGYTTVEVKTDATKKKFWSEVTYEKETRYSDIEFLSKPLLDLKPAKLVMTPRKSKDTPGTVTLHGIYKISKDKNTLELNFSRQGEIEPPKNVDALGSGIYFKYERIQDSGK